MIEEIIFCLWCAICNRARGSQLFGLTSSTAIGRLVSMAGISFAAAFLTLNGDWMRFDIISAGMLACLMFWCVWGWDSLWGQTITGILKNRLIGLAKFALRMTLAAPCLIGLSYYTNHSYLPALFTPLLAIPYFVFGYLIPEKGDKYVIPCSEPAVGIILGILIFLSIK